MILIVETKIIIDDNADPDDVVENMEYEFDHEAIKSTEIIAYKVVR